MRWPAQPQAAEPGAAGPGAGSDRTELGEPAAWGIAVGGAAVWGLAAAARAGWLRVLLDLYPRSSWERITWVLIPVLLLLPLIVQGVAVAWASPWRPVQAGRGIVGSIAGTLIGLAGGLAVFVLATRVLSVPAKQALPAARTAPVPLILGCGALLVAVALRAAARSHGIVWLRSAAMPVAVAAAAAVWLVAREWVLAASYVLDRAETAVFFVAVAAGGAIGAAWSVAAVGRQR
jgi:hypothetical protein